jgi:hypothetical protein
MAVNHRQNSWKKTFKKAEIKMIIDNYLKRYTLTLVIATPARTRIMVLFALMRPFSTFAYHYVKFRLHFKIIFNFNQTFVKWLSAKPLSDTWLVWYYVYHVLILICVPFLNLKMQQKHSCQGPLQVMPRAKIHALTAMQWPHR